MLHDILHFFGRAICHQIEDRSLQASGETLSICARDTGIYIGIFSTLAYLHLFKRKAKITIPSIKISLFLLLLVVPMIIDGLGSYIHLFESNNARRLVSGTSFGFGLPYFLYPLLSANSLEASSEPVIKHGRDLFAPLFLSCGLGGLVFWEWLPYYLLDGFIILTVIVWFSLCASFLFSWVDRTWLRSAFSIFCGLIFLTMLSLLHGLVSP
ncbi:DUF2085 domain-containing protein [Neobacillus novalis]|uniref:DUF2085 domain-containing protein n=1 Tax=Neobacillus novalis TaxID=220687 RepID=A0AA95SBS3_9BACI|nr:DUF2085 domain-containing protein [Neobacillus novalis]WHY85333.1 DUF2085 domain-containing protein [Neobacillus novalis]